MKLIRFSVAATVFLGLCGGAHSQVLTGNLLLRQPLAFGNGAANQIFPDYPTYSTGMGSLVTVGGGGWSISNIQVFQIASPVEVNSWYGNVNQAILTVSLQSSGAPNASVDPTIVNSGAAIVYSGFVTVGLDEGLDNSRGTNQSFRMTADTSGISQLQALGPGSYVFSLVPRVAYDTYGQTYTGWAADLGPNDYIRNPGGGYGLHIGTSWGTVSAAFQTVNGIEWGIGINGSPVPEPASIAFLGLGLLAVLRRRRR
jgi:hypothetical protein